MSDFTIKANDMLPSIQATLQTGGIAVDLTGAASVKFIMVNTVGGTIKVNTNGTIVTPASGVVRYDWTGTDTNTPGTYNAEWQVTWTAGTKKQTFPTTSYHSITILADLDGA